MIEMTSALASRDQFPLLFDRLGIETAAEIGVGAGTFARTLLASRSLRKLYLVDPWPDPAHADYRRQTYELAAEHGQRVEIIEQPGHEAVRRFADGQLDAVYLDAMHEYEFIRRDLGDWWLKARVLLAGHDYIPWNYAVQCPCGVMLAVEELAALYGLPVYVTGAGPSTWVDRLRVAIAAGEITDHGLFAPRFPSWYILK